MSAIDTLERIAPEFANDDTENEAWLDIAAQRLNATAFGGLYTQAVCYLAAHLRTLARDTTGEDAAQAGGVTAKSAGDVSESYGGPTPSTLSVSDAALWTTKYGREFLQIRNSRSYRAARVISPGS